MVISVGKSSCNSLSTLTLLGRCSGGGGCGQFNNFVELSTVGCAGGVCGGGRRGRRFAGKVRKGVRRNLQLFFIFVKNRQS